MGLAVVLVVIGIFLMVRNYILKIRQKKELKNRTFSEGETLNNKYIIDHEQKLIDDKVYDEYLDWCKFKGEVPAEKNGFDKHRMEEYQLYKKLIKHGIKGL